MAEIAGLKLIVPSSVAGSGVSVSASGKVTFTAATSVSVNGCFTSTYDNYLIVMRHVHSTTTRTVNARLRASGSDASGSDYTVQELLAGSTTVSGFRHTSQTFARVGVTSNEQRSGDHIYIYGPYLAQPTAFRNIDVCGYNNATIYDYASTHSLSTSYDGITFYPNSDNMTGVLCIYGLAQ
jgi:hypothetical protein